MKKAILAVLLAACGAGSALAQTSQGSIIISGNMGISTSEAENTNYHDMIEQHNKRSETGINFSPGVGFFISEGVEAGTGIGLSYRWEKQETRGNGSGYQNKNYGASISPYLRKYFQLTEKLMFHGTGYIAAGIGRNISGEGESKSINKNTSLGAGAYPGLTYFVTEKFGINTTFGELNYTRRYNQPGAWPKSVNNDFRVDLSLSTVTFGLSYFIAR